MSNFVHLRCHTNYSISESTLNIKKIAEICKNNNMPAIACTDTNNLYCAREFSNTIVGQKIKPIIGMQLNVKYSTDSLTVNQPLVLLAKNQNGYKNLLHLHKIAYNNYSNQTEDKPFVDFTHLTTYNADIICLTGGVDGLLAKIVSVASKDTLNSFITLLNNAFNNNLYIELNRFFTTVDYNLEPKLLEIASNYNIPIVATNNVAFASKQDYEAADVLMCIGQGVEVSNPKRKQLAKHSYFKSAQEMQNLFKDLPEAIENTWLIAQRCSFFVEKQPLMLPSFSNNEEELIKEMAHTGLQHRLDNIVYPFSKQSKTQIDEIYYSRLNFELEIIIKMGFSGYFLIVSDFIKWAKNNDIAVGPGRGSGAGSLVAWALFIIDVDPIKYSLFFERFLNPYRVSMPDFDIDFCQDNRDKVINYVRQKYGEDKVASIITFGTLQPRAAIKDVGRALGILYSEVDTLTKKIPFSPPSKPLNLQQIIDSTNAIQQEIENHAHIKKLMDIALKVEGLYRNISTHAAGVVIAKNPIHNVAPIYFDVGSNFPTVGFSMKYIEDVGLVKFDFLALKTLNIIQNTVKDVKKYNNVDINVLTIATENDEKINTLLAHGNTFGIFQIESGGMTELVKQIKPTRIEDIIAIISLYRPGPMENIPAYVARSNNKEKIEYLHPKMQPSLQETYGIMIYQEQVMEVAKVIAGYTLGEADILRRAMGKKDPKEMMTQKQIFIDGAKKHNDINPQLAEEIFNQMERFASYGFNKSHSTAYAMLAWQTAYLKAHYTAEFLSNCMHLDSNNIDKFALYLQEASKFNITVLPPSVNNASNKFTIETIDNQKCIRYSLNAIKGLGENTINFIKEYTQKNKFVSLEDFLTQMPNKLLNKKQLEALISSGALDDLHQNRNQLLQNIEALIAFNQAANNAKNSNQIALFDSVEDSINTLKLSNVAPFTDIKRLQLELEVLGCFLSGHPLNDYKKVLDDNEILSYNQITEARLTEFNNGTFNPKNPEFLAGYLMKIKVSKTKTGAMFASLSLYDMGSIYNVILFGDNYTKFSSILQEGKSYIIKAFLKIENEETKFFIDNIQEITPNYKKPKSKTYNKPQANTTVANNTQPTNVNNVATTPQPTEKPICIHISLKNLLEIERLKSIIINKPNYSVIINVNNNKYLLQHSTINATDIGLVKNFSSIIDFYITDL